MMKLKILLLAVILLWCLPCVSAWDFVFPQRIVTLNPNEFVIGSTFALGSGQILELENVGIIHYEVRSWPLHLVVRTRHYTLIKMCDGRCGSKIKRTEGLEFRISEGTEFHIDKAGEYRFIVLEIKSGYIKIKRIE